MYEFVQAKPWKLMVFVGRIWFYNRNYLNQVLISVIYLFPCLDFLSHFLSLELPVLNFAQLLNHRAK